MEIVVSILSSVLYFLLLGFLGFSVLVNRKYVIIQISRILFIIFIIAQVTWFLLSTFKDDIHNHVIYRILPDINKILLIFIHYLIAFHWYEFYNEIRLNRDYGNNISCWFYFFWGFIYFIFFMILSTYVILINLLLHYFKLDFDKSELYYFLVTCSFFPFITLISSVLFTYYAFDIFSHVVVLSQTLSLIQRLKYVSFIELN